MVDNGLRFLTPKEYVFESIHKVPSVIRIEMTPEMSVFWIMGLFFNTVGNGDDLSSMTVDIDTEVSDYKWGSHGFPADGMILKSGHRVSFQDDPNVETRCDPYPNFSKEKSIVWSRDEFPFESMGVEWTEAALWFYENCLVYFSDPKFYTGFHRAFPTLSKSKSSIRVNDCIDAFAYFNMSNEDLSRLYMVDFQGNQADLSDVEKFLTRRWALERQGIVSFIKETIDHLNDLLQRQLTSREKMVTLCPDKR